MEVGEEELDIPLGETRGLSNYYLHSLVCMNIFKLAQEN
jgi:hypothetical protein